MAALITTDFSIPNNISEGIFKKAQTGSVLARLSGAKPQKFGTTTAWVLTGAPKAELVGEGVQKSPTPTTYAPKTITPLKVQVTMRYSNEVQWADEDVQIGVLQDLAENAGIALGRALDLAAIHKINPLTGTVSTLVKEGFVDCTQKATVADKKYDETIEAAAGSCDRCRLYTVRDCYGHLACIWIINHERYRWQKAVRFHWIRSDTYQLRGHGHSSWRYSISKERDC